VKLPISPSWSASRLHGEYVFNTLSHDVIVLPPEVGERKRAERAQAHLAAIIDSSDDAIIARTSTGPSRAGTWAHRRSTVIPRTRSLATRSRS